MSETTTPFQYPAIQFVAAQRTPGVVTGAKVVAIVHGSLLLAVGGLLVANGVMLIGIASLVEGALRLVLGIALRRGARRTRQGLLGLSAFGAFAGFAAGGLSIVGGLINVAVIRCLVHDDAKQYLAA